MSNDSAIGENEMSSDEDDEPVESDEDEMSTAEGEEENGELQIRTYLPEGNEDTEDLVCDESAYILLHRAQTGAPCLSFDVIPDDMGDNRGEQFPLTCHLVAGTQAERTHINQLLVLQMSNMHKNKSKKETSDDESEESEEEDETQLPKLKSTHINHPGCVNRVRVTSLGGRTIAATWSELRSVYLWEISSALEYVQSPQKSFDNHRDTKHLFAFKGHPTEGFAMDWCTLRPGVLATGDCSKNIHLWTPQDGGTWHVDQRPFTGHTASVEDIQWSPDEPNVLASCSVDKSIRIWDMRAAPNKACMLAAEDVHSSDVNVISWNHLEPFLLSGGDDGLIKIWDLRQFQSQTPVALFKHHKDSITSVEWHPTDASVYAASGADNQITLWDLAVERDTEAEGRSDEELKDVPPQLLFIHQGQKDVKELHWHPQMPGVVISTALSGFNVFRTISV